MADKVTPMQKKLVHLLAGGMEQAEAYAEAGYSCNTDNIQSIRSNCQKTLKLPVVKAYRQQLEADVQTKAEKELSITKIDNLKFLEKIKKEAMEGSFKQVVVKDSKGVVKLNNQGKPITQYSYLEPDRNTAIKATQEQNKMLGYYEADKVEHSMTVTAITQKDYHQRQQEFDELDARVLDDED